MANFNNKKRRLTAHRNIWLKSPYRSKGDECQFLNIHQRPNRTYFLCSSHTSLNGSDLGRLQENWMTSLNEVCQKLSCRYFCYLFLFFSKTMVAEQEDSMGRAHLLLILWIKSDCANTMSVYMN